MGELKSHGKRSFPMGYSVIKSIRRILIPWKSNSLIFLHIFLKFIFLKHGKVKIHRIPMGYLSSRMWECWSHGNYINILGSRIEPNFQCCTHMTVVEFIYLPQDHIIGVSLHFGFDDFCLVFSATFSNISAISWRPVLVVEEAGIPGENHRPYAWASNW